MFDYYSAGYDISRTLQIQLKFANKSNPTLANYWNWKAPKRLSEGYGKWTRVTLDLSTADFKLDSDWQPGNSFNLDKLEGITVRILKNGKGAIENTVYLDNIELR